MYLHEYYNDIIHKGITNDTPIHSILKQYESWIRWYNVNKDEPSVRYALQSYRNREMPKKSFDTMIAKGLARFKKKMHNVEKVVTTRRKVVKEARNYGTSITFPPYDQRIIIN